MLESQRAEPVRGRPIPSDAPVPVPESWPAAGLRGSALPTVTDTLGRGGALPKDRPCVTILTGDEMGRVFRLGDGDLLFGPDAEVRSADNASSRPHARFFRADQQVYVEDLGSPSGTLVNGRRIHSPVILVDGDRVQLGAQRLLGFSLNDAAEEEAALQIYEATIRDVTTGVLNRRCFEARFEAELTVAARNELPLVVLLLDIDDFKKINDTYGHLFGDTVLRIVAANVQRLLRRDDLLARFGGDELVVLCPRTTLRNGLIVAERLRSSIERLPLSFSGNELHVTVSVGVAGTATGGVSRDELLATADRAMYRAKLLGRNAVAA